jgi:hypothetical protein
MAVTVVSVMGPAGAPMKKPYASFAGKQPFLRPTGLKVPGTGYKKDIRSNPLFWVRTNPFR